jgi:hypothetical protein
MHPDSQRLFAFDASLRSQAEGMLARSGIGPILDRAGYHVVGSYRMRTMTWRDLDFERYEEPAWNRHWEVGTALAQTGWCWRLNCVNTYRERSAEQGLYWGIRLSDPSQADPAADPSAAIWKLDLWTVRPEEFAPAGRRRETWASLMTDENRSHVLAIKDAVCTDPGYRKSLLSVHIYEAVLENGIRDLESFRAWWASRYGQQ